MSNRFRKLLTHLQKSLIPVFIMLVSAYSCSGDNKELSKENIIPEKIFLSILSDVYLADGLLALPEIRDKFSDRDTVSVYIDIIESHGYTYEDMNNTVKYYFIKNPKQFVKLYDQVLAKFTEMESGYLVIADVDIIQDQNWWYGKPIYIFPELNEEENAEFSITMTPQFSYKLEFTITVYPDDQTANPSFIAWYCHADSAETGKRTWLPEIKYIKDGYPHTFSFTETAKSEYPVVLKGSLYNYENNPDSKHPHAVIFNISVTPTLLTL